LKWPACSDVAALLRSGRATEHVPDLLGNYSVHTCADAPAKGEANIERLRQPLVAAGDRRRAGGTIPVFREQSK